jgi:hypothetical protein
MAIKNQKQPFTPAPIEEILEIQHVISLGLCGMPAAKAKFLLKDKKALQQFVTKLYKELEIPTQSKLILAAIPLLVDYYNKVYNIDISEIYEMEFPIHELFQTFMAVSPKHNEDEIMDAQKAFFKISFDQYETLIAGNINHEEETKLQKRPSGLYLIAHSGEDGPDTRHRNKSYNDAVAQGLIFATLKEYLLMTGFHRFTTGYFMDNEGSTRTSSLWLDGGLVCGRSIGKLKLRLEHGSCDFQSIDYGPRELFLTL